MDFKSQVYFELRLWNHALINHWIVILTGCGNVSRQFEPILQVCSKLLDEYVRFDNPPCFLILSRQHILDCAIETMRLQIIGLLPSLHMAM